MQVQLSLALPRDTVSVPVVRRVFGNALDTLGVEHECIDDIQLALSEACTNVLDHARDGDDYCVTATVDDSTCTIAVVDQGGGFDASDLGHRDAHVDAEEGRGIQLMRRLVDSVSFQSEPRGGTVVSLVKRLQWRPDSPLRRLAEVEEEI